MAPSQVGVNVNDASSRAGIVIVCELVAGQEPVVVYSTVYVAPVTPLVISPVVASIMAPSVGTGLNTNVPPVSPVIIAVAPVQFAVSVNDASSASSMVTLTVFVIPQDPGVVYSTV